MARLAPPPRRWIYQPVDASRHRSSPSRRSAPVVVDAADIEKIVARIARIPARQASSSDRERLRTLEESLQRVVFGQDDAVHLVAQAIKRSRAGLGQPDRPAGCFLFTGPTGVNGILFSPSSWRFSHFRPDSGMRPFLDDWLRLGGTLFVVNLGDQVERWRLVAELLDLDYGRSDRGAPTKPCWRRTSLPARAGLVTLTWGNVSGIDRERGLVAIKPSGVPYDAMTAQDIVVVDLDGNQVDGERRPSTDTPTHLALYRAFEPIGGVVHTHSTWATAWAQAEREIPILGTTHADLCPGPIPLTRALINEEIADDYEGATGTLLVRGARRPRRAAGARRAGCAGTNLLLGRGSGRSGRGRRNARGGRAPGAADDRVGARQLSVTATRMREALRPQARPPGVLRAAVLSGCVQDDAPRPHARTIVVAPDAIERLAAYAGDEAWRDALLVVDPEHGLPGSASTRAVRRGRDPGPAVLPRSTRAWPRPRMRSRGSARACALRSARRPARRRLGRDPPTSRYCSATRGPRLRQRADRGLDGRLRVERRGAATRRPQGDVGAVWRRSSPTRWCSPRPGRDDPLRGRRPAGQGERADRLAGRAPALRRAVLRARRGARRRDR